MFKILKAKEPSDPLTGAAGSVAFLLAVNKPVYPLYLLFLAPSAFEVSLFTALSLPLYLFVWGMARKGHSYPARLGIVIVGMIDTILISFLLGGDSGALLFLFACTILAGVVFYDDEKWVSRVLISVSFLAFLTLEGRVGPSVTAISASDMQTLYFINVSGVAALMGFIALRLPRPEKQD